MTIFRLNIMMNFCQTLLKKLLPLLFGLLASVLVKAYGTDWRVEVFPTPKLIAEVQSPLPSVVLIGGLVLSWLLGLIVHLVQVSSRQIQQLKKANRQLQWEIYHRHEAEIAMDRLAAIVASSEDAIISKNLEGIVTSWNAGAEKIFGYTASEMLGQSGTKLIPTDYQEQEKEILSQIQQGERIEHYDTKRLGKNGALIDVSMSVSPIKDKTGKIIGVSKIARNITERKQAVMALEQELLRSKTFFNTSMDGVVIINQQGQVVEASPSFAQMLGYTLEETLKLSVFDWDVQWTKEELQLKLKTTEILPLFETKHRRKDGSVYDVEISFNCLELEGELMNFCVCRDISDRKQAEIDLQISQARFAGILEIASDAIISVNNNHEITLFNKGAERIFGYTTEEVLGKSLALLMPDRFAEVHHQHISQYANTEGSARPMAERGAIFGRRKDGTEFLAEASISKIEINGEIIFTTFLRDITARQQAEEALRHQKELFQTIIDCSPMMIALFNGQGQIEFINPALERILGWSLEDWQQKDILAECYPDPVERQSILEHILSATGKI